MSTENFLFEMGCEELPASSLQAVAEAIQANIIAQLDKAKISYRDTQLFFTPRRIAVQVLDLAKKQPEKRFERQGPSEEQAYGKDGLPTLACLGFVKSCNATLDDVSVKETKKGRYLVCQCVIPGSDTEEFLPSLIENALKKLPIPKPMRWSDHEFSFIRPVHWVVMLFGNKIIPTQVLGKQADRITYGHRFMHPEAIELKHADDYQALLLNPGKVIASFEQRKTAIVEEIDQLSIPTGRAVIDEDLLNEVTLLVEWPVVLLGSFSQDFLSVPAEALVTSMQEHQRCFPVFNDEGVIQPYFVITSNIESKDPQAVIKGNEKVIHARLSDAKFFYQQDIKTSLAQRFKTLEHVVFEKQLGTIADKVTRVEKLISELAKQIEIEPELAKRAAYLSKCDLVSSMVYEFPELQGIMGEYYALHNHEDTQVAISLKEQYLPRFSGDRLPISPLSCALAVADRMDTLVGIFGINKKPTGDKDPFALRRAALGVVRILIEKALPVSLDFLLESALSHYKDLPNKNTLTELKAFIFDRMKAWYQERDVSYDVFEAVAALDCSHLTDFDQRISAVQHFLLLPEAKALAEANKRVHNILKKQDKVNSKVEVKIFKLEQESQLYNAIETTKEEVVQYNQEKSYSESLDQLAQLKPATDAFFEHVMVMDEDLNVRENRLALLAQLRELLSSVADISLIQVK